MDEKKSSIPLPLTILFFIIVFFIMLILSTLYFQSKLREVNSPVYSDNSALNTLSLTVGIDPGMILNEYYENLTALFAKELKMKIILKKVPGDQKYKFLEENKIDLFIAPYSDAKVKIQKNNISNSFISINNFDILVYFRKQDFELIRKLNLTLKSLVVKGVISDLHQKYFD